MNIAYILPSLSGAAPIVVIELLSRLMVQHGHKCEVYYFDNKIETSFACPVKQISAKQSIDFSQYDIVHSTGMRPDIFVAKFRQYSSKTRYITTIHNFFMEDFCSQYNWFVAQFFGRRWMSKINKLDCVTTLSNIGVEYYNKWISKAKLTFAYNSRVINFNLELAEEEKRALLDFKYNSTLIGINAMLSPIKGIEQIIKALTDLPNYKLFIVGDGKSRKSLEKLAIQLGVNERVFFAGFIKNAYRYLPYYDLHAVPSRSEGFPLVLLEASQHRVPTLCSRIPIFEEIFNADEVAFFELDNIPSLIEAIQKTTSNEKIGERMFQRYERCYSPQKMYEQYLGIYNGEI